MGVPLEGQTNSSAPPNIASDGTAVLHGLGPGPAEPQDPLTLTTAAAALPEAPSHRARRATFAETSHLDHATDFNGAVWPCLGSALWALRTTRTYEEALSAAIDLGGDTDTVAAVTGGLAGAVHGAGAIPARWTEPLHLPLPGFGDRVLRHAELTALARALAAADPDASGS
ncbi:ADP-ribosylglycohydrolase family protein [Streptomyces sp. NBC_01304]|uniref:ADP-ribosylglycohydrolase family protein n=1 Tax=Streptomyces sp. NBC_01304 TaxID=2903818 RepID=UPI003FA3855E